MNADRKLWKAITIPMVNFPCTTSITPMPSTARLAIAVMAVGREPRNMFSLVYETSWVFTLA